MIDAPPDNATPPPEPVRPRMGFIIVPSVWALAEEITGFARQRARRDFNADIVRLPAVVRLPCDWVAVFEYCNSCAGVWIYRDPSQRIPSHVAQLLDFFFGRDKAEALVYEWQPFEKTFRLVDRDWLNARRRAA